MEELAQVIEVKENKALVRIRRNSACSKCDKDCNMAGTSHETDEIDVEINNNLDAEEGNYVKIELGEKSLVWASLIVYIIPLLGLIGGYFITNWLLTFIGYFSGEITGIAGSITFFFLSFLLVKIIDFRLGKNDDFQPKMIKILK